MENGTTYKGLFDPVSSLLTANYSHFLLQPLKYSQISPKGVSILMLFLPLAWNRLSLNHMLVNSYWSLKVKFKYKLLNVVFPNVPTPSQVRSSPLCTYSTCFGLYHTLIFNIIVCLRAETLSLIFKAKYLPHRSN